MPDFSQRSTEVEVMDDLGFTGEVMDQTLYEIEVINKWLGGNAVTLGGLHELMKNQDPTKEISIADLGCGRGDMLQLIAGWAKRENRLVRLIGFDANPYIIQAAKNNLWNCPNIELVVMNIFSAEFRMLKFDIVIGTLFYHHFSNEQLLSFFLQLKDQVRIGHMINDLHRHNLAFYSIKILTALFSSSSMVKADAPLSVLRAFTKKELVEVLRRADVKRFSIRWKWAFRWQVLVYT